MKQIEVNIMGQSYLLGCPEGAEPELMAAVKIVDREMCVIRDAGKVRARERIAVLAALNIASAARAEASPQPASATELPAVDGAEPSQAPAPAQEQLDLQPLIDRLDHALQADGQLL